MGPDWNNQTTGLAVSRRLKLYVRQQVRDGSQSRTTLEDRIVGYDYSTNSG